MHKQTHLPDAEPALEASYPLPGGYRLTLQADTPCVLRERCEPALPAWREMSGALRQAYRAAVIAHMRSMSGRCVLLWRVA